MYHFLAIFRQSDRDPTNVVVSFATLPVYPQNGYIAMYAIFAYMHSQEYVVVFTVMSRYVMICIGTLYWNATVCVGM